MSVLTINRSKVAQNYLQIQKMIGSKTAAAVVKANAYGCGVAAVAETLQRAGAQEFFVATLPEALELRTITGGKPALYMLNGFDSKNSELYKEEAITPVLNTAQQIEGYRAFAMEGGEALPAIVHIDTGMNRLGLEAKDIVALERAPEKLDGINIKYVMSHFVCADEKDHPMNEAQRQAFQKAIKIFPGAKKSLANSSGIFRSQDYHLDMVRPGMCLYGLNPTPETDNPMHRAVSLDAEILEVREAQAGEFCGYNATHRFGVGVPLAVVAMGYADGFLRAGSNEAALYWKGHKCPVRGRVSMDLTTVDLSAIPENMRPRAGDMMEVIGENQSADDLAAACGTIGYEILTSLSRRYQRAYKD